MRSRFRFDNIHGEGLRWNGIEGLVELVLNPTADIAGAFSLGETLIEHELGHPGSSGDLGLEWMLAWLGNSMPFARSSGPTWPALA